MPTVITQGAASAKGYGFGASSTAANYIEDVFSTYLYTGTASAQTITNGIDLSGKGGLVWLKSRNNPDSHYVVDTARGSNKVLYTNLTNAEETLTRFSSFNSNGFSLATTPSNPNVNGYTYASWTFRKQAKFFDIVTYTGNGTNRTIAHNLGSVPGCIIVKCTSDVTDWAVYHRSLTSATNALQLNTTGAQLSNAAYWNSTAPTSTVFSVGTDNDTNGNLRTYVAYLFAHDAGGFGATGSDNVISCGLTTANGSGDFSVNLGYEPQWVLMKSTGAGIWSIVDNMRGATASSGYTSSKRLQPQSSAAEDQLDSPYGIGLNATGFAGNLATFSNDFIYIAIRRGPMKTPTTGTSVFAPVFASSSGTYTATSNFPVDMAWYTNPSGVIGRFDFDRLRGNPYLGLQSDAAEVASSGTFDSNVNFRVSASGNYSAWINYLFRRAPGFFDVVCYTGTGGDFSAKNHNLGVVPELIIIKNRTTSGTDWPVWATGFITGNGPSGSSQYLLLNTLAARATNTGSNQPFGANPTATTFTVGNWSRVNDTSNNYVAYLFATVAGVSKVGSYTGTAALQTINCGFTGGARFVLIKRTDSTGDWYVWDSARGISSGNDPYLLLNSTAAEVTGTNYVDTTSTGFQVTAAAPAGINANGGTYIFLAIA